jgi:hypothetical protein
MIAGVMRRLCRMDDAEELGCYYAVTVLGRPLGELREDAAQ